jgi:hypothetical protein
VPKAKGSPIYAKAAKLDGEEKAIYLARGELDEDANAIVTNLKTLYWTKRKKVQKAQLGKLDPEQVKGLLARYDKEVQGWHAVLLGAIVENDCALFRKIADVLEQHKESGEHVDRSGNWHPWKAIADPAAQAALNLAMWDMVTKEDGARRTFSDFWDWISSIPENQKLWSRWKVNRVENLKGTYRATAKGIGIVFAADARGPKKR